MNTGLLVCVGERCILCDNKCDHHYCTDTRTLPWGLSVFLSVCPPTSIYVCPSVSVCLSLCLLVSLALSVCRCTYLFIYLVVRVNPAFHLSGLCKLSTGLSGFGHGGLCSPVSSSRSYGGWRSVFLSGVFVNSCGQNFNVSTSC